MQNQFQFTKRFISLSLLLVLFLSACAGGSTPKWHPVTTEESQLFALSRFKNFEAGARQFSTEINIKQQELIIDGWVNYEEMLGVANVKGKDFAPQIILWDGSKVSLYKNENNISLKAYIDRIPINTQTISRPINPSASLLDTLLVTLLQLGIDRPENPLLLQQTGTLWLKEEVDNGKKIQIFAGPPSGEPLKPEDSAPTPEKALVKYGIDVDGMMWRVEILLQKWVIINFNIAEKKKTKSPDFVKIKEMMDVENNEK